MKLISDIIKIALEKFLGKKINLDVSISRPGKNINAHYASNILFFLKNELPKDYENPLKNLIEESPMVDEVQFLNGYLNLKMTPHFFANLIKQALIGEMITDIGKGEKVNVEYVSINPTGFLHIGHARGAIIGDAVASILKKAGYDVTKEYYLNDAGKQVALLAESIYSRYCDLSKNPYPFPEGGYQGQEIIELAEKIFQENPNLKEFDEIFIAEYALNYFIDNIKKDLAEIGIFHDIWISEKDIIKHGLIEEAIEILSQKGLIYEGKRESIKSGKGEAMNKPLLLFKSTAFGDDLDRPLTKSDDSWTYFAPDIGYHLHKIKRGYKGLICFMGADHDSYSARLKMAVKSLDQDVRHDIILCQIVSFEKNGESLKLSKRLGQSIKVSDFVKEISPDILRFIMLSKKANSMFVFDYQKASEISMQNPVFYVQYAHARACSVISAFGKEVFSCVEKALEEVFQISEFQNLAISISMWPKAFQDAAKDLSPHVIVNYIINLSESFHHLWQVGKIDPKKRFITESTNQTEAKIMIICSFKKILAQALCILGISSPERME